MVVVGGVISPLRLHVTGKHKNTSCGTICIRSRHYFKHRVVKRSLVPRAAYSYDSPTVWAGVGASSMNGSTGWAAGQPDTWVTHNSWPHKVRREDWLCDSFVCLDKTINQKKVDITSLKVRVLCSLHWNDNDTRMFCVHYLFPVWSVLELIILLKYAQWTVLGIMNWIVFEINIFLLLLGILIQHFLVVSFYKYGTN